MRVSVCASAISEWQVDTYTSVAEFLEEYQFSGANDNADRAERMTQG